MFCPNCGANVPENQPFCAQCGAQTAPAAAPRYQQPASAPVKLSITKDAMFGMRVVIVALAILSIFFLFSKGISCHIEQEGPIDDEIKVNTLFEWDDWFKYYCMDEDNLEEDEPASAAVAIVFQTLSVVLIVAVVAATVIPVVAPQLASNKFYNLIPAAIAAFCLLLFVIMLILALALCGEMMDMLDEVGMNPSVTPAYASWFYMACLGGIGFTSYKMFKGTK